MTRIAKMGIEGIRFKATGIAKSETIRIGANTNSPFVGEPKTPIKLEMGWTMESIIHGRMKVNVPPYGLQ